MICGSIIGQTSAAVLTAGPLVAVAVTLLHAGYVLLLSPLSFSLLSLFDTHELMHMHHGTWLQRPSKKIVVISLVKIKDVDVHAKKTALSSLVCHGAMACFVD